MYQQQRAASFYSLQNTKLVTRYTLNTLHQPQEGGGLHLRDPRAALEQLSHSPTPREHTVLCKTALSSHAVEEMHTECLLQTVCITWNTNVAKM